MFQEPKSKKPSTNTFKGKTKFTPQDDALMLDFYILNGKVNSLKTWTALAAEAPNHPPDGWKNRFNKMASRALRIQEREWIMRKAIKELEKDDNDDQEFDIPVASSSKGKKYDDDDEQEFDPPVASSSKDLKRKKYDDIDSDIERDLKLKFVAGDESEDLIGITRQKGGKGKRIQWDDNDEDFNYDDQEIVKPNKINVARTRDIEEIIKPSKGKAVARTRVVEDEDEIIKPNKGKALARKKATDDEDEINPIKSKAIVRKKFTIDNDEEITPHQSSPPKVSLKNKSNSTSPRVAVKNTSPSSNIQQAKKFESTSRPTARASTGGLEKTRNSDQSLGRHSIAAQRVEPKQNQASNPFNYNAYEPSPLKHDIRIDSNGRKYKVEYIDESPSPQPEITDPIIGIKPIYSPPKKIQRTTQPIPETRVLYPTNQLEKQKQKLHQEFSSDFDRSEIDRIFNQCSNDFALARRYCSVQDIDDLGIREKRLVFSDWDDILVVGDSEERKEIEERKGFEVCEKRRAFLRAN